MPEPKNRTASTALRKAFLADLPAAWNHARWLNRDETPYAFVLYGVEGGSPNLWPVVLTEQSLDRVARLYVDGGYHDTVDEARRALRLSVADSPLLQDLVEVTPELTAATEKHVGVTDDDTGYKLLADAAVFALKKIDATGLFGTGEARSKLLLAVIVEDVEEDFFNSSVAKLNPPGVVAAVKKLTEIKGIYRSAESMVVTGGGDLVFTVGSSANPNGKPGNNEFLHELVAYSRQPGRLVRHWDYTYEGFGDSLRAIMVDPGDGALIVLRQRFVDKKPVASLMRFQSTSNVPTASVDFDTESNGATLTVAGDGRIAIAGHRGPVLVLDRSLKQIHSFSPPEKVSAMHFLPGGALLVGSRQSLRLIDPETGATTLSANADVVDLSVTTDGATAAVCGRPWKSIGDMVSGNHPQTETPVTLFRLSDLTVVGTITDKGWFLERAVISGDGSRIACAANEIGSARKRLVAFHAATGGVIARRKAPQSPKLLFMPDHRTVAVGKSGTTETAPVEFWDVGGAVGWHSK